MRPWTHLPTVALVLVLVLLVDVGVVTLAGATSLTPEAQRGQHIYRRGSSLAGHEINAVLEQAGLTVPATVLPCVNCHGDDGRGKAEGGVTPADISWQTLTKPYGIAHSGGRTRPPYTVPLLKRAITMGLDAAGQRLHVAMPRYQFSHSDLADLLAYLQQLGHATDPGVTETTIRLGTILPPRGFLAEMSQAIQAALMAYVDDINTQGGIYQRRIELLFDTSPEAAGARLPAARAFLAATQVFALVGSFMAGADADMAALVAEQEVPVVGAFALYPQVRFPLNRQVFYLSAGVPGQGQVLLTFMAHRYATAKPPLAILAPDEPMAHEAAETLAQHGQTLGWETVEQVRVPPGPLNAALLVQALRAQGTEIMLILDPRVATATFFHEAHRQAWHPIVLIPGAFAERALLQAPASFEGRLFLAFPTLPTAAAPGDMRAYRRLAAAYKLPPQHLAAQLSALSSAQLLVEGLKRAGREVSRQKLIEILEGLYEFRTGFSLALSYSPNRRIGALGTHIVTLDRNAGTFVPVGTALAPP